MKTSERDSGVYSVSATPSARRLRITTGGAPTRIQFEKTTRFVLLQNADSGELSIVSVGGGASGVSIEALDEDFTYNIIFRNLESDVLELTVNSIVASGATPDQIITMPMPPDRNLTEAQFVAYVNNQLLIRSIGIEFSTITPDNIVIPEVLEADTSAGLPVVADRGATAQLRVSLTREGLNAGNYFVVRAGRTMPALEIRCKELWFQAIAPAGIADYDFEISVAAGLAGGLSVG